MLKNVIFLYIFWDSYVTKDSWSRLNLGKVDIHVKDREEWKLMPMPEVGEWYGKLQSKQNNTHCWVNSREKTGLSTYFKKGIK